MTQKNRYRIVATCLTTYSAIVEAVSVAEAGEKAFLQEKAEWSEIGKPDWQVDRVEPIVANDPAPVGEVANSGGAFPELLSRRTHLLKLITELTETLQSGFLPPHVAQELTGRRSSARMELKGVEVAINNAGEGGK
jgi:hypothetical protein